MQNLKRIKVKIDKIISKIEDEAIENKVNTASKEFADVVFRLKEETLAGYGITVEEYDEWESQHEEELREKSDREGIHLELKGLENKLLKGLEQELLEKIKIVEDRKVKYGEVEDTPHIPTEKEIDILIKRAISEIPKPKEPDPLTREDIIKVHDWTDHNQLVSEINEIDSKINTLSKENKETKEIAEKASKVKPVISQPLLGEKDIKKIVSKEAQEAILEPVRRMGMGIQNQVDILANEKAEANQTMYIGTTGVTINRSSAALTLADIRITPRVTTEASSATPTINTDNSDIHSITALAVAITSMTTNLSGTPVNGQKLIVRILDDGTGRAITWGASFSSKGATLPTSTIASKLLTVGLIYNTVTSDFECVAVSEEE